MPKIANPLTNTQVKNAKCNILIKDGVSMGVEKALSDGQGLVLRVKPNGNKLWVMTYIHPFTRKRCNFKIGQYPSMSLADAREDRTRVKALLAKDIDPKAHRDKLRIEENDKHQNTLISVASRWFVVKKTKISADYSDDVWRSLEIHVFPALAKTPITQLSAKMAIDALQPVAAKGSLETVKRVCQRLNKIMTYAVNTGLAFSNPLAGINQAFEAPKATNLPSLAPNQLPVLLNAIEKAKESNKIRQVTRSLMLWQLNTMVRPSEAAKAAGLRLA
jgi:hypothetical protein